MLMILTYTNADKYENDIKYEISWEEEIKALKNIIYEKYFSKTKNDDKKLILSCIENYLKDTSWDAMKKIEYDFEELLLDYFKDDALNI